MTDEVLFQEIQQLKTLTTSWKVFKPKDQSIGEQEIVITKVRCVPGHFVVYLSLNVIVIRILSEQQHKHLS